MGTEKIKIIGVGGAGTNTINKIVNSKLENVETYVINSDKITLDYSSAQNKVVIGKRGIGCDGDIEIAKKEISDDIDNIKNVIKDSKAIIITAGMGGGFGTTCICEIAKLAKEQGIPTVAIVTKPLSDEGDKRNTIAINGLKELKQYADKLLVVNNDKVLPVRDNKTSYRAFFKVLDDILRIIIEAISTTIIETNEQTSDITINLNNVNNVISKVKFCDVY